MAAEFIRVNARMRPSARAANDRTALHLDSDSSTIRTTLSGQKCFVFDNVFGPTSTQDCIFQSVGKRIIDGALNGINGTIFAYGQTGSGKTHTMLGPAHSDNFFNDVENKGLIPRVIEYLFSQLESCQKEQGSRFGYTVSCMFVELYNEVITDLLTDNCPRVTIRAETKNVQLQGTTCEAVTSFIDAMRLVQIGWENRRVGETAMNKDSSRSHAVLIIDIVITEDDGGVINKREARINMVDLAGSERQSHTQSSGIRLKEAGKINQSLCTLGRVIRDLSSNKSHVPYRDSKLTLMIRDSLGGNSRTAVIVCVHPDEEFFAESLSTLQFAEHCRLVKNELHINREVTGESVAALRARIVQLQDELESVKKDLHEKFEAERRLLQEEIQDYKSQLSSLKRERETENLEDTLAGVNKSPPTTPFKTPAAKKERRKTRFTLSTQRAVRETTKLFQEPLIWGDQFENKENATGPADDVSGLDALKELIRAKHDEVTTIRVENDQLKEQLSSYDKKVDTMEGKMNTLEKEKADLQNQLGLMNEEVRQVNMRRDELEEALSFKDNEIVALMAQVETEKNAAENAAMELRQLAEGQDASFREQLLKKEKAFNIELANERAKLMEKEKKCNEVSKVAKVLVAQKEKLEHTLEKIQADNVELKAKIDEAEMEKTAKKEKIAELEHYNKLLKDQLSQLTKISDEERSARRKLREAEVEKEDLEKELFEVNERLCTSETQVTLLRGTVSQKDEEIASLVKQNEDIQSQLADMTGHNNRNQKIKLMEKYSKENAQLRADKAKMTAELARYKKEFGCLQ